jgi:bacteriocin biosynthesis cyclodehydratase domain-containing protein
MDLPATVRLARHTTVVAPAPGVRALGTDPATALVVEDLAAPLADLLDRLVAPAATPDVLAEAAGLGVPAAVTGGLLRELHASGALVDAGREDRARQSLSGARVTVHGRGPLVGGIVVGLALAGAGTVHTATGGQARPGELGTGLSAADVGESRLAGIQAALARVVLGRTTGPPPARSRPDLAVLADERPDPVLVGALHRDGVPYLRVALRDGRGIVGPLVLPGRTACLRCLDRHAEDDEPWWPALVDALAGRAGAADPACAAATAAFATAQALTLLEGVDAAAALGAVLDLDVVAGTVTRRPWDPHPRCPCRGATSGAGGDRGTIEE